LYLDNIWYIDLPQLSPTQSPSPPAPSPNPELIECSNITNGISHPHPSDPASFVICRNGTQSAVFACPRTLIFDPNLRTCNAPEHVLPNLSCEGKTGPYAYPNDSTKFIVCRQPSVLVDVYDCPKPLQFDSESRACALNESVAVIPELPVATMTGV
jgi:hypothetical protein